MNIYEKKSLFNDVGTFLDRMQGQRNIGSDDKQSLIHLWKRLTGETIWCTTCSAVITDLYRKLDGWHEGELKQKEEEENSDALLDSGDYVLLKNNSEGKTYVKADSVQEYLEPIETKKKSNGRKPSKKNK